MLQAKQDTDYFVATFDIQFDLSDWARVETILFRVVLPHHAHSSKILALSCFSQQIERLLTEVRASVSTAPVGSTIVVDINEAGTTILSTKLSIDAAEKTSTTAATPAVISDASLADDAEISIDIDQIGSGTAGKGLKVVLIGYRV